MVPFYKPWIWACLPSLARTEFSWATDSPLFLELSEGGEDAVGRFCLYHLAKMVADILENANTYMGLNSSALTIKEWENVRAHGPGWKGAAGCRLGDGAPGHSHSGKAQKAEGGERSTPTLQAEQSARPGGSGGPLTVWSPCDPWSAERTGV